MTSVCQGLSSLASGGGKMRDAGNEVVIMRVFSYVIKVYMTQKNFSAYLKGLSKYRRMAFFLFEISFFSVLEILTFFYYANYTLSVVAI